MTSLPSVLVVDDDAFTAELAGMVLEEAGHAVTLAEGGVDALEKLAADPSLGVVVSDMNMPFMDGLQLLAEMREQGDRRPFILLTGDTAAGIQPGRPEPNAVLAKDEHLSETLPKTVATVLA